MKRIVLFLSTIFCLLIVVVGCKSDAEKANEARRDRALGKITSGKNEPPPEFTITAKQLLTTTDLAPNKTYKDNGLGVTAKAGHTFVCAEYTIANAGTEPASAGLPMLIDTKGAEVQVSSTAAGKTPWKSGFKLSKIESGEQRSGYTCYEVATDAVGPGMTLRFKKSGWGKQGAWEKTVKLPEPKPTQGY